MNAWSHVFAVLAALALFAQHHDHSRATEEFFEFNKNDEVQLPGKCLIGKAVLPKGRYKVERSVQESAYLFTFTPVLKKGDPQRDPIAVTAHRRADRRDRVRRSLIYAHTDEQGYLILRIEIAGENADYFF